MRTTLRFRLYPNHTQEERLLAMVEAGRRLWNSALAQRKRRWDDEKLSTSYRQQCLILTAERRVNPALRQLYAQAAQDILRRLDRAFKAFFAGRTNYPSFKKFCEFGSFTYPQAYNGSVTPDVTRKRLFLSRIGNVKIVYHRELPEGRKLKVCTVVREASGEWVRLLGL
jgi:putative transposase